MNTPPAVERHAAGGRVEFRAHPAGAAFYLDEDGAQWRIYDCLLLHGILERVYLEADGATHRVFVEQAGPRRLLYRRTQREVFKLSPETCARQLGAARPLQDEPAFDARERE